MKRFLECAVCALVAVGALPATAEAKVRKGDRAPLFKSVDENLKPVDMKDMINGKPLVLVVGSAS